MRNGTTTAGRKRTTPQVAALLGVSVDRARRAANLLDPLPERIGFYRLFDEGDVERLKAVLEERRTRRAAAHAS